MATGDQGSLCGGSRASASNDHGELAGAQCDYDPIPEMQAFDQLPKELRRLFRDTFTQWSVLATLDAVREFGAIPELVKFVARDVESRKPRDAQACYGASHPQSNALAPRSFFKPLRSKRISLRSTIRIHAAPTPRGSKPATKRGRKKGGLR